MEEFNEGYFSFFFFLLFEFLTKDEICFQRM